MRLTDEQRALAEEHLYLLRYFKIGRLQDRDDLQSVIGEALCCAAFYYREGRGMTFKSFAIRHIKQEIGRYFKRVGFFVGPRAAKRIRIESTSNVVETGQTCDVGRDIEAEEDKEWLWAAARRLPPKQRTTIEAILAGQKVGEIAQATDQTMAAVSMNHCNAIKNLRRQLV